MEKILRIAIIIILFAGRSALYSQILIPETPPKLSASAASKLPGFSVSPYFDEQVRTVYFEPEVRAVINAPSAGTFDPSKPVKLALFALPNGNTIEWTVGKALRNGDDWHYDIQHIAAQTRFIRNMVTEYNLVTVYLETSQKSWPAWRTKYANNAQLISKIVDSVKNIFGGYSTSIILTGHSGGGSFTFGYLNSVSKIPDYIERISFLDSNYGYDDSYGPKFSGWLKSSQSHYLSVIAYNDSVALLDGKPIVSATGGTWYRSKMMYGYLSREFPFTAEENADFIKYISSTGRIKILLKQNPERKILHTVQVELNGFIQGLLAGTQYESRGYTYYGPRAYTPLVQNEIPMPSNLKIPVRPASARTGSEFMNAVKDMTFENREEEILKEISAGNIPEFLRELKTIKSEFTDTRGIKHKVYYQVMPDYLSIGNDKNFCRIPVGPVTAQKIATLFGAVMPTPKLVDDIYLNSDLKLAPVTYTPVGNQNELVPKFVEHNTAIEAQRKNSGLPPGVLIGGIKKDVVISNKITDPARPGHVVIYGWHKTDGTPIQPLTNIHSGSYVDYSHGIRLLNRQIIVDSAIMNITDVLKNEDLYKMLSNESGVMAQPGYLADAEIPAVPASFGVLSGQSGILNIRVKPDTSAKKYKVLLNRDGSVSTDTLIVMPDDMTIKNLLNDSLYYIRVSAVNTAGESAESEMLAGIPTDEKPGMIFVHGFDRTSAGNTRNFLGRHISAFRSAGIGSAVSATNDAVLDGLFSLNDYKAADYILGDESTVNETFSTYEQILVKSFLQNGGSLFVSGSEIAWDLDAKGTASDKTFLHEYLRTGYLADAPNGTPGVFYRAEALPGSFAEGLPAFGFDNGNFGTINVKYPDALKAVAGGGVFLKYSGVDTSKGCAGVCYSGKFPGGTLSGHVVLMGFPFESVYPAKLRTDLAGRIIGYFGIASAIKEEKFNVVPEHFALEQNYPNPFNASTVISYSVPSSGTVTLSVFDALGREVKKLSNEYHTAGQYKAVFDGTGLASGIYIYTLRTGSAAESKKCLLLK
ncbi:MAG: T9SS type A sorting domain-containing protein [Bacteroidota bacterium]